jgi:hypothetical protein
MSNDTFNLNLVFPDGFLKEMEVQEVLYSPESGNAHVLIMLHDMSQSNEGYVVRTYMLKKVKEGLLVDAELEAFAFPVRETAVSFGKRLPTLTGIEMLMLQNGYEIRTDNSTPYILQ